jgi:ATP-dependent Clp protease ATP-binding subunit ClpA
MLPDLAHDWAVSRLIGPQPGYIGSDKPEAWLTTRVRQQPDSLILLDEIEKSHPTVWNTFLRIFDDGRLTEVEAMPPERVNRLDAVIVFDALTPAAIREIAGREIAAALVCLRERGYEAEVAKDVVRFVSERGYDPACGARHLHRNIERHLLETLVDHPPSKLRAAVSGDGVAWNPACCVALPACGGGFT